MEYLSEKTYMKVRLFRLAQKEWNLDFNACGELFRKYQLYDVIDELYDTFHVQGDQANLDELRAVIDHDGEKL